MFWKNGADNINLIEVMIDVRWQFFSRTNWRKQKHHTSRCFKHLSEERTDFYKQLPNLLLRPLFLVHVLILKALVFPHGCREQIFELCSLFIRFPGGTHRIILNGVEPTTRKKFLETHDRCQGEVFVPMRVSWCLCDVPCDCYWKEGENLLLLVCLLLSVMIEIDYLGKWYLQLWSMCKSICLWSWIRNFNYLHVWL